MSWKQLKREFENDANTMRDSVTRKADGTLTREGALRLRQYWELRLLYEINGNLDSLVVAYRDLVKLTKQRMGNGR